MELPKPFTEPISTIKKANYGIDAPGVIRNLFLGALFALVLVVFFPIIKIGPVTIETDGFIWACVSMSAGAFWMLAYSTYGKFKHRDRMLNQVNWSGNEQVLDVGTGKGLLMIGAAKKLSSGKAIGIDIWNAEDLTGNHIENTLQNAKAEGVGDKVEVMNENAMQMSFANESFDVILSNECLHNIYDKPGRKTACLEIARVLKQGGTIVISDHLHTNEYKQNFEEAGLKVKMMNKNYLIAFPPLRIVCAYK